MAASQSVLLLAGCGFVLAFALAVVATRLVLARLRHGKVLDVPNQRSSHAVPTPRGGGWGVVIAAAAASLVLLPFAGGAPWLAGLGVAIAIAVALSWRDDLGGLPVGLRLAGHYLAAASALAALAWTGAAQAAVGAALSAGVPVPLLAGGAFVLVTGYVWFVNLYNFMDGIDELTAVETASLMLGTAAVAWLAGATRPELTVYPAILAGAALGFLVWNRHPAKVFLGDVGSIPLGLAVGFFLLTLAASGHPLPAAILPLYYVADATLTLLRRLARGEKVWQAHRSHWYQRAARAIGHRRTVLIVATGNAGLFLLALAALSHQLPALAAAVVWTAGVLAVLSLCARRAGPCPAA